MKLAHPDDSAQIASDGRNASGPTSRFYNDAKDNYDIDHTLVRNGRLSLSKIIHLLQRYKQYYHPFFPIVSLGPVRGSCRLLCVTLIVTGADEYA